MINYIGLDGEMSGTDLAAGHRLIQIGLARYEAGIMSSTSRLINPGEMLWSAQAEEVHLFTKEYIESYGVEPPVVDAEMVDWIPISSKRDLVMVGFNVSSFDRPFVEYTLPHLYNKFSRRSVDLNSIIFAMSDTDGQFQKIKGRAKDYALEQMEGRFQGFKDRQHDAEYDAVMALYCFEYLRTLIKL